MRKITLSKLRQLISEGVTTGKSDTHDIVLDAFIEEQMKEYDNNPDQFHDTKRYQWEYQVWSAADQLDEYLDTLVTDLHNGEYATRYVHPG